MGLAELASALLGEETLQLFAEHVPEIAVLQESSDQLRGLKLAGELVLIRDGDEIRVDSVDLSATAADRDFYDDVQARLNELVGRNPFLSVNLKQSGQPDEYKSVSFRFPIGISGRLFVYNPNYRG